MIYLQMSWLVIDLGGACAEDERGRRGVVVGRDPASGGQGAARRSPDAGPGKPPGDQALLAPIAVRWERLLAEAGRQAGRGRPTIAMETYVRLMVIKHRSGWGY